jgi:hypothetical protein
MIGVGIAACCCVEVSNGMPHGCPFADNRGILFYAATLCARWFLEHQAMNALTALNSAIAALNSDIATLKAPTDPELCHCNPEGTEGSLTAELEGLFVDNKVDVSYYGHIHSCVAYTLHSVA